MNNINDGAFRDRRIFLKDCRRNRLAMALGAIVVSACFGVWVAWQVGS